MHFRSLRCAFLRCSAYLLPPCANRLAAVRRIFTIIHHSRCDCVHKIQNFCAARISRERKIYIHARRAPSAAAPQKRKSKFPRVRRAWRRLCKNKNLRFHAFRVPGFDSAKVKFPVFARPARSAIVRQNSAGRAGFHFSRRPSSRAAALTMIIYARKLPARRGAGGLAQYEERRRCCVRARRA